MLPEYLREAVCPHRALREAMFSHRVPKRGVCSHRALREAVCSHRAFREAVCSPQTIGSGRVLPTEQKSAEVFLGHLFEQPFVAGMSNHRLELFSSRKYVSKFTKVSRNTA